MQGLGDLADEALLFFFKESDFLFVLFGFLLVQGEAFQAPLQDVAAGKQEIKTKHEADSGQEGHGENAEVLWGFQDRKKRI
ncbi:hypothetical protein [uncultured Desulfuromonas sp.]|uniref:hypothetical protein n=1 Tax=uncultured Desulfuromonas sp. TaxID=181013 RepID=UPI0026338B42|nr:hypothetical protein [uncultured Desulfuromonas sp.]